MDVLQRHPSVTGVSVCPAHARDVNHGRGEGSPAREQSSLSNTPLGEQGRCKLCELTIHFAALSLALPPSLRNQLWHDIRRSSYRTPHLRLLYLRRDLPFLGQQKSSHREEKRIGASVLRVTRGVTRAKCWRGGDLTQGRLREDRGECKSVQLETITQYICLILCLIRRNFLWSGSLCFLSGGNRAECLV